MGRGLPSPFLTSVPPCLRGYSSAARLAPAALVVVRVGGLARRGARVPGERLHDDLDGLLKLRVVTLPPGLRVEFDLNVGRDARVLDLPPALGAVEGDARRGDLP